MRHTKIATPKPFEGAPKINLCNVFGASPGKPIILRIPVTGQRPITYGVKNLPAGLELNDGIITGQIAEEGDYTVTLTAENALGYTEKQLTLEIHPGSILLSPLMGFTSWNAFGGDVSQEKMLSTAKKIVELGISEYGYSYINTDSGWQGQYGGEFDAVQPNEKFPDMKAMCDEIHAMGLKCGIYSSPMKVCWPYREEPDSLLGCTCGEPDILFGSMNGGIGKIRKEMNNATQWAAWNFDYLKYDWYSTDPYNAELMRVALQAQNRDFGFCVTVLAAPDYHRYWETYCTSYRCNEDAHGTWDNLLRVYGSFANFATYMGKGHFFDLDMLDIGTCECPEGLFQLTEDEKLVSYSLRAMLNSPIQISSKLDYADEFELSVYCNEEVIAINQDSGFCLPERIENALPADELLHIYKKPLANGDTAYAAFNLSESVQAVQIDLEQLSSVRDLWAKEDLCTAESIRVQMHPHTVRMFRVKHC